MQVTQAEVHPTGRFWIAWAARDFLLIAAAGAFFVGGSYWRAPHLQSGTPTPLKPAAVNPPVALDRDHELAEKIRKAIATDEALSSAVQDLKIIVRNGIVTLKGVVDGEQEGSALITKAARIAGASNIRSQLTVLPEETQQASEESQTEPQDPEQQVQEPLQ